MVRGGTRGGRDQFSWEDVKADKNRESYLGASVHANVGRWQEGRDLYWYTRAAGGSAPPNAAAQAERRSAVAAIQRREQELMDEALGLRPRPPQGGPSFAAGPATSTPAPHEIAELLERGRAREAVDNERVAERIHGVGSGGAAARRGPHDAGGVGKAHDVMEGTMHVGHQTASRRSRARKDGSPRSDEDAPRRRHRHRHHRRRRRHDRHGRDGDGHDHRGRDADVRGRGERHHRSRSPPSRRRGERHDTDSD